MPLTLLALASYEKGHSFLQEAKRQGARVLLLTSESLRATAHWPTESLDGIYYMPDTDKKWNRQHTLNTVAYLARTEVIDRLVPLDDFDLEMAAFLREHLRIPGMGETTTRYFRDKLAMRMKAETAGLNIPPFVPVLHHQRVHEFTQRVPPPWVLKPRLLAGSIGIHKVSSAEELWAHINRLGDEQSYYLVEQFIPGDICHVDSIVDHDQILFAVASRYGRPPLDVSQGGGVFTTRLVERGSPLDQGLLRKNQQVLAGLGLKRGVSHTEFIVAHADGKIYFLETSARVGGAHIAEMVECACGINLWIEWARLEFAVASGQPYKLPKVRKDYAGIVVSLTRQEWPDTTQFNDPEIDWRMSGMSYHIGLIVRSPKRARVLELLDNYVTRIQQDYHASAPAPVKPLV